MIIEDIDGIYYHRFSPAQSHVGSYAKFRQYSYRCSLTFSDYSGQAAACMCFAVLCCMVGWCRQILIPTFGFFSFCYLWTVTCTRETGFGDTMSKCSFLCLYPDPLWHVLTLTLGNLGQAGVE